MRAIVAVVGILAVAWLVLYLSSYGVLVSSSSQVHVADIAGTKMEETGALVPNTLRCTYFIATGFHDVDYNLASRQLCPRLWSFGL